MCVCVCVTVCLWMTIYMYMLPPLWVEHSYWKNLQAATYAVRHSSLQELSSFRIRKSAVKNSSNIIGLFQSWSVTVSLLVFK